MNSDEMLKRKLGKNLKLDILIGDYTTMKVGGKARYFYVAENIEDLIKAILAAKEAKIRFVVVGGGSNVIFADEGYDGLVVLNRSSGMAFIPDKAQVIVDSGVSLMRLVVEAANRDFGGIESLYGIPGTVGGAIYGNAGAQGTEICSLLKGVTLMNPDGKIIRVKPEWLNAGYRTTKIKKIKSEKKETPIILSALIQLSHQKKEEIIRKMQYYKKIREEKQPYDKPSAGSIFKNAGTQKEQAAGYILEEVGAKKLKSGQAEVSKKHANFIVNAGDATADDVIKLINEMKKLAHDDYGVDLEEEVEYIV